MDNTPYVKSILKALRILDIFGFDDPLGNGFTLGELSKMTGIAPNTLCKILKTMVRAEYLTQDDARRYHSSHKTSMIHLVAAPHHEVADKTARIIQELCDRLEAPAYFTTLSFGERKTILNTSYGSPMNPAVSNSDAATGKFIYTKPTGRVLVSYANSAQLNDILERWGFPEDRWDGIGDLWELVRRREIIRRQGYCAIMEENDLAAIAVPVKVEARNFLGALGAAKTLKHDAERQIRHIVDMLKQTALKIAETLS